MTRPHYSEKAIEILDAAEIRMRRGGFDAVSYRDLAADVGIKGSSVHYHFPKKSNLGKVVVDRYAERILTALGPPDDPQEDIQSRIHRLCLVYQDALIKDGAPCLCCALGSETLDLPSPVAKAVNHFLTSLIDWTTTALGHNVQTPSSSAMARHIIGALQGTTILVLVKKQPDLFQETETFLLNLIATDA